MTHLFLPTYHWLKCNLVATLTAGGTEKCDLAVYDHLVASLIHIREKKKKSQIPKLLGLARSIWGSALLSAFTLLHCLNFSQRACIIFKIKKKKTNKAISI